MRQKRKRILKQLVALTLAIVLFNSNISILEVLAGKPANHVGSVTQPQGNANPAGASGGETKVGYDFNVKSFADTSQCINSRAYLITIQKIENTARGNARFEAAYRADNTLTQVAFSAADQYLSNYPGCFSTSQITSDGIHNYALVGVKDNNGVTGPSALPSSSVVLTEICPPVLLLIAILKVNRQWVLLIRPGSRQTLPAAHYLGMKN